MKIAISAESTIDVQEDLLKEYNIEVIPYKVIMGNDEFADGEVTTEQLFDFVKLTGVLPKTSALNQGEYKAYFEDLLKKYDAVIHITLSSLMSSSHHHACAAANELQNVYVIDSGSLSTGIALLCLKARDLANAGLGAERIAKEITDLVPKVQASFILDKLNYLVKGGRCNALVAFGANLLQIKPQIIVKDGKMIVGKRYMGKYEKNVKKYCEDTLSDNPDADLTYAFVTYSSASPESIATAKEALASRGFKNVFETHANATVSSHCGPNTIGILFLRA